LKRRLKKSRKENGGRLVLDTSFLIEILDRGRKELAELLAEYEEAIIPWISLYEYLYGHKVGRRISDEELLSRKEKVESLGLVAWNNQRVIEEVLKLDLTLAEKGEKIPFSDLLVAAFAEVYDADLATFDKKHFKIIKNRLVP